MKTFQTLALMKIAADMPARLCQWQKFLGIFMSLFRALLKYRPNQRYFVSLSLSMVYIIT
jgi:hypothetical protein